MPAPQEPALRNACGTVGLDLVVIALSGAALRKSITAIASGLNRLIEREEMTDTDKTAALSRKM